MSASVRYLFFFQDSDVLVFVDLGDTAAAHHYCFRFENNVLAIVALSVSGNDSCKAHLLAN